MHTSCFVGRMSGPRWSTTPGRRAVLDVIFVYFFGVQCPIAACSGGHDGSVAATGGVPLSATGSAGAGAGVGPALAAFSEVSGVAADRAGSGAGAGAGAGAGVEDTGLATAATSTTGTVSTAVAIWGVAASAAVVARSASSALSGVPPQPASKVRASNVDVIKIGLVIKDAPVRIRGSAIAPP